MVRIFPVVTILKTSCQSAMQPCLIIANQEGFDSIRITCKEGNDDVASLKATLLFLVHGMGFKLQESKELKDKDTGAASEGLAGQIKAFYHAKTLSKLLLACSIFVSAGPCGCGIHPCGPCGPGPVVRILQFQLLSS